VTETIGILAYSVAQKSAKWMIDERSNFGMCENYNRSKVYVNVSKCCWPTVGGRFRYPHALPVSYW